MAPISVGEYIISTKLYQKNSTIRSKNSCLWLHHGGRHLTVHFALSPTAFTGIIDDVDDIIVKSKNNPERIISEILTWSYPPKVQQQLARESWRSCCSRTRRHYTPSCSCSNSVISTATSYLFVRREITAKKYRRSTRA